MKRFALALATAGVLLAANPPKAHKAPAKAPATPVTKLTKDEQIVHVLNRLTFGPRPGDIDEVRRIGLEKWIDLQIHPDRIAENALLNDKLKPFETLRLTTPQIIASYPQFAPPVMMMRIAPMTELLKQDQITRLLNGTIEERKAVIDSLDPEKRKQVLLAAAPPWFAVIPELKKEVEDARKAQQEGRQAEMKRQNPPLNELLDPAQRDVVQKGTPAEIVELLDQFDPTKRQQIASAMPRQRLAGLPDLRRLGTGVRQPQEVVMSDLREGKVLRAVYSNRQLEEVLVDFWYNHFNVFEGKMSERPLLASYERDAVRPHVFGHFKDLLLATAHHPAMLYYLDNWESIAPGAFDTGPFAPPVEQMARELARRARGINENYGRELLELHTLGVSGGYTQDDVIAVARCFTGWTIAKPATEPQFVFAPFMHDTAAKVVLGHTDRGRRRRETMACQVIDILAHHPSTAKFISKELAQRFVADDPAEDPDRSHGPDLHENGWRSARRTGDDVQLIRVLFRRRVPEQNEVAVRDGCERGARHRQRRHRRLCARAARLRSRRTALRQARTHGVSKHRGCMVEYGGPVCAHELRIGVDGRQSSRRELRMLPRSAPPIR